MSRAESFQRVAGAIESGDFAGVSEDDLAIADNDHANRLWRQWIAGGRVPLPLHDPEEGGDCVTDVLVRVSHMALSTDGRRLRMNVEHNGPLRLEPGDMIYVRRASPVPDPEKRR